MKLLIINYEMDDESPVLAWQASTARALASLCDSVVVLTEKLGNVRPAPRLIVKEIPRRPYGIPQKMGSAWLVNLIVSKILREYKIDACFIHMNQKWAVYLAPVLRAHRIPVLLWYAHGSVSINLRLAHRFSTRVVTSTPSGFRLPSRKLSVIGQGVDTDLFQVPNFEQQRNTILMVGRISARKNIQQAVDVMERLFQLDPSIRLKIIGSSLTDDDRRYMQHLKKMILEKNLSGQIEIVGFVPQAGVPAHHRDAFLHFSLSKTGSMDKALLESLACGCPVLTSNEAFFDLLKDFPDFVVQNTDPDFIARRIVNLKAELKSFKPDDLRKLVVGRHDAQSYSKKIYAELNKMAPS